MTEKIPADLIRQEADLIEGVLQMQAQGLDLLLAEMRALAGILPGSFPAPQSAPQPATDATTENEAETEAGFDNMPV